MYPFTSRIQSFISFWFSLQVFFYILPIEYIAGILFRCVIFEMYLIDLNGACKTHYTYTQSYMYMQSQEKLKFTISLYIKLSMVNGA